MSNELIYIGNRYGQLAVLLIAVPVGAFGAWLVLHDSAWAGTLFLVVAVLMAAVALPVVISPQSTYLHLDSAGFEVGSRRRKTRVKWEEVAAFRFDIVDDARVIEIEYASGVDKPVVRRILDAYNASLSDILSELVGHTMIREERCVYLARQSARQFPSTPLIGKRERIATCRETQTLSFWAIRARLRPWHPDVE